MSELQYPFPEVPEPGTALDVGPGIKWIRMPLPMALDHINLYLLDDGDGWWVVDTGMKLGPTQELWEQIFERELKGKPVGSTPIFSNTAPGPCCCMMSAVVKGLETDWIEKA